jgi:hypothetical protein
LSPSRDRRTPPDASSEGSASGIAALDALGFSTAGLSGAVLGAGFPPPPQATRVANENSHRARMHDKQSDARVL